MPIDWTKIKYFDREEFDSPDEPGSGDRMNPALVHELDAMREECKFPFLIESGFRTWKHNVAVGGEENSSHLRGEAVDIRITSSSNRFKLLRAAYAHGFTRIGIGRSFIHLDKDPSLPPNVAWNYPATTSRGAV